MAKKIMGLITLIGLLVSAQVPILAASFDTTVSNNGVVGISHKDPGKRLKVMITKGSTKYTYDLNSQGETEFFPLQMGNGEYKVSILVNVSGTKYSYVDTTKINLNLPDPNVVFLNSVQNIKWNNNYSAIKYGKSLSGGENNMSKKVDTLYNYVVKNYKYDYDKVSKLTSGYTPDIEDTFRTKKGICYDYSALLAGMQRSQGLPTKLVKGYASGVDGYHAWNEVFVGGKWVIVDTTFDAAMWGGKVNYSMVKNASDYKKVNEY